MPRKVGRRSNQGGGANVGNISQPAEERVEDPVLRMLRGLPVKWNNSPEALAQRERERIRSSINDLLAHVEESAARAALGVSHITILLPSLEGEAQQKMHAALQQAEQAKVSIEQVVESARRALEILEGADQKESH